MGCKAYLKSDTSLRVTSLKHLDKHLDTRLLYQAKFVKQTVVSSIGVNNIKIETKYIILVIQKNTKSKN